MKRQTYIYTLIPLYAILGFVRTLEGILGPVGAMVAGALVCLVVWGLVWLRLYGGGRLRPELAVLGILPPMCYLGLKMAGDAAAPFFEEAAWRNMYFFTWCASVYVLIQSVRCTPEEAQKLSGRELQRAGGLTYILAAFIILYAALTWMGTASDLYGNNL